MYTFKKAYLEITNVCNLSCAFCPGTRRAAGFMSPERFRLLAGRLRPHTEYLYLHLMGEPLLHPDLPRLLDCAAELGFQVMITTNGVLLPQRSELLCASPVVKKVNLSLQSFEGNKSSGSLGDYLDGCVDFALRAERAGKRCALRLWNLDGAAQPGANRRNGEIIERLEEAFPPPWKENRQGSTLGRGIYLEWGERFQWPDLKAREEEGAAFCYGLRDQVGVLWDGTVVPCCLDHEGDVPLGNLYEQALEEILASKRARAIYDGFSQGQSVEELCRRCAYRRKFR